MQVGCCVTTLVLCAATAFARIGETETQIEKRYGRPTYKPSWTKTYSNKNFVVIITFDNGVSGIETFIADPFISLCDCRVENLPGRIQPP